ncbi:GDSL-type esterase/lipase family protein [Nakamurella aerolata]|uniref:SGNH hydrolase-type esterase domain-containing protein n=1 Tax=Nakamurella aerolata TaxID=1656892 RepID=A0A849AAJ9_9ACTN|nr:GDSL-type esterase/lipase family protein [Nakamurella aerolata]NNG36151.1 hypothetical protein [Nakamurella aerolata]
MTIVTPANDPGTAEPARRVVASEPAGPVLVPRVVTRLIPGTPAPLVVALGDSVTAGVGDSAGAVSGWSAHLAHRMRARHCNLGRNGARAADVRQQQLPVALTSGARLATVFIGGNDVLRGDFDPDSVCTDAAATLTALRQADIQPLLVLPPMVGPELPAPAAVRRVLGRRTEQLREALLVAVLLAEAAAGSVLTVDAQQVRAQAGASVFHIDRIHPSPTGHRLLAAHAARRLVRAGWVDSGRVVPVPPVPSLPLRVGWLVARGLPWLARRSRDLLPELASVVWREEIAPALASRR